MNFQEQGYVFHDVFHDRESTTNALFALLVSRELMEKYREERSPFLMSYIMCLWSWRKLMTRCREKRCGIGLESRE